MAVLRVAPHIVREVFDGEVVAIDLDKGVYYSMEGVAAAVWQLLEQGSSAARITETIAARYEGEPAEVHDGVTEFLAQLAAEGLVIAGGDGAAAPLETGTPPARRTRYSRPVLAAFTDMRDLLILDPIHEVDEAGWPTRRPPDAA